MASNEFFIHPTSVIDEPVEIGEGTKIWHFSHVMSGAKIGRSCIFGQNVFIGSNVKIGNNVKVQNNVSIYDNVFIEDDVFCGPSMVFTNVVNPRSFIIRKHEYRDTIVKRGASIGANATIVCGITLGEYCFIGAGAVVTKNVPPFGLMVGIPATLAGWFCHCGIRLDLPVRSKKELMAKCKHCDSTYCLMDNQLKILEKLLPRIKD
jgi:UDP-2-acetamido-3-amino-2,3-dideoxy-glucuronate N-acetyltransferase